MPIKKNPDKGTARSSFLAAASLARPHFLCSHARRQSPQDRLRPRPLQEFAHCCQQLRLASNSLTGPDEDRRGGRPGGGGRGDSGQVQHPRQQQGDADALRRRRGKGRQPQGLPQPATTGQRATAINARRKRDDLGSTSTCGGGAAARPRHLRFFDRSWFARVGYRTGGSSGRGCLCNQKRSAAGNGNATQQGSEETPAVQSRASLFSPRFGINKGRAVRRRADEQDKGVSETPCRVHAEHAWWCRRMAGGSSRLQAGFLKQGRRWQLDASTTRSTAQNARVGRDDAADRAGNAQAWSVPHLGGGIARAVDRFAATRYCADCTTKDAKSSRRQNLAWSCRGPAFKVSAQYV